MQFLLKYSKHRINHIYHTFGTNGNEIFSNVLGLCFALVCVCTHNCMTFLPRGTSRPLVLVRRIRAVDLLCLNVGAFIYISLPPSTSNAFVGISPSCLCMWQWDAHRRYISHFSLWGISFLISHGIFLDSETNVITHWFHMADLELWKKVSIWTTSD